MTDEASTNDELAGRIASSVRSQREETDSSRRRFLGRSAVAGTALLALGTGAGTALADEHEADAAESGATFDDVAGTDVDVLNYALTLEHLESAFYREGLEMFTEDDFLQAEPLQAYDESMRREIYGYVQTVGQHEDEHVDVLTQAIELLGGQPAEAGSYAFEVSSVQEFLELGATFENTGVSAYAGAAPYIESPDLLSAALSIHSVEARHAAVLNKLTGQSPFPNAFDPALSQNEVLSAVTPYLGESGGDGEDEMDGDQGDNGMNGTDGDNGMNGTDGDDAMNETDGDGGTNGAAGNVPNGNGSQ